MHWVFRFLLNISWLKSNMFKFITRVVMQMTNKVPTPRANPIKTIQPTCTSHSPKTYDISNIPILAPPEIPVKLFNCWKLFQLPVPIGGVPPLHISKHNIAIAIYSLSCPVQLCPTANSRSTTSVPVNSPPLKKPKCHRVLEKRTAPSETRKKDDRMLEVNFCGFLF